MPHSPVTWRDHLRYRFENTLSKGAIAMIGWLGLVSGAIVLLAAAVLAVLRVGADPGDSSRPLGAIEGAWQSLMHTLDPGALAADQGWGLRALMFLVTLGGIFIVSVLIGTITSGLETRLDELRKGRSRVIERNHTLILGWSSKVYSIVGELLIANSNQKQPRIVILADRDKVGMEDDIKARFPGTQNTTIICRRGNPLDLDDLAVVDPHSARSIIVLAPEGAENPDIHVIKSVLAVTSNPDRKAEPYHIVGEIGDPKNLEAAALVGGQEAIFISSEGSEIYIRPMAGYIKAGVAVDLYTVLEAAARLDETAIGYRLMAHADERERGYGVTVNPKKSAKVAFGANDQIIVLAED